MTFAHRPYLGISGITDRVQLAAARKALGAFAYTRPLMAGFQMSWKSLHGLPLAAPWGKRMLTPETLGDVLTYDAAVFNVVHYAPGEEGRETLFDDMARIVRESKPLLVDGFQINTPYWPDPSVLASCKYHRDLFPVAPCFVIQVNATVVHEAGGTPAGVAGRLGAYGGIAEYALFDMSGGRGRPLDSAQALGFLRAIRDAGLSIMPVVSGGLGPSTLHLLDPILAEFPDVSTDMEGACMGEDGILSLPLVEEAVRGIAQKMRAQA